MNDTTMTSSKFKSVTKKIRSKPNRRKEVPSTNDAHEELVRLVKEHKALTKSSVAIINMTKDKKFRETGEVLVNNLPQSVKDSFKAAAAEAKDNASKLESAMTAQLKQIPIYNTFLKHVYGFGPVVCAHLCAMIDIRKAEKPSNLRRYCGFAVINGKLERPGKAESWMPAGWCKHRKLKSLETVVDDSGNETWRVRMPLGYNAEMRTRLYQAMSAMWKNSAKKTSAAEFGSTTKYLDVWVNSKYRDLSAGKRPCEAHSKGWHKACDVFLEDMYIIWRAIEGLPVWPSYYAAKLGYQHGGKISVNAPRMLTVEEALELVGFTGAVPLQQPRPKAVAEAIEDEEMFDAAE